MTLKAAIVGTGAVAHLHAQALTADPRVDLVAVSNRSGERREVFADRYGVRGRYTAHTDLLAQEDLDLVVLCTPPHLHREQALDAFAAGAHVLCEKPPALSLAELDAMQAGADAARLALAFAFQQRTGTAAAHVRHLLESGELGRPLLAQCQTLWLRDADHYAGEHRGTWDAEGGGTTFSHGIHQMDLLADLLGDWAEVDARLWRVARDIETEDVSTATVRFTSGALAVLVSSVLSPRETSALRIDTELATIELEHLHGHRGTDWRITPARDVDPDRATRWTFPLDDEPSGHAALVRGVVDALTTGSPLPAVATHARRPLELVTAVYASATHGRPVTPATLRDDDRFQHSLRADVVDARPPAAP